MPLLWCSISGHGFGHAAQVVPVLNALGELVPDLRVILRTTVPGWFFEERLTVPWAHRPAQQDIGCVQNGPLQIDVAATWAALEQFHADWDQRLAQEVRLLLDAAPDLVLSNISYFALAAATQARLRCLALASLAWDEIMQPYADPENPRHQALLDRMSACYAMADLLIRVPPGLPLRSFASAIDVGPIVEPLSPASTRLRQLVNAQAGERLVHVAFGGVSLASLPYERMDTMEGYRFLVDGPLPHSLARIHSVKTVGLDFMTTLASTDVIMTKPGYSTIVEAVDKRIPVVYVRRYNFADEQAVVDYLHRHGRGVELSMQDFVLGHWRPAIDAAHGSSSPSIAPPPPSGTTQAAAICARYCSATAG